MSMCLTQKEIKDSIKKKNNPVTLSTFISSFLNLIKSLKDK